MDYPILMEGCQLSISHLPILIFLFFQYSYSQPFCSQNFKWVHRKYRNNKRLLLSR